MPHDDQDRLTLLGRPAPLPSRPDEAVLETFPNPHPDVDYVVRLTAPEFTSLCPITGQPDFAVIVVDYVPRQRLVESKSYKLFLGSFRNYGAFHEACTVTIHKRLHQAMDPQVPARRGTVVRPRRHYHRRGGGNRNAPRRVSPPAAGKGELSGRPRIENGRRAAPPPGLPLSPPQASAGVLSGRSFL